MNEHKIADEHVREAWHSIASAEDVVGRLLERVADGTPDAVRVAKAWDAFMNNARLDIMMALRRAGADAADGGGL